jgi:GNAT superfamily N-acetyltransferase
LIEIRSPTGAPEAHDAALMRLLEQAAETAGRPFAQETVAMEVWHDGAFAGGLSGRILYGWLLVRFLAVVPEARGRGLGAALMRAAEARALERGALGVHVDTFGFQAPGFYERLGYVQAGVLPGRDAAEARHYYVKRLRAAEGAQA